MAMARTRVRSMSRNSVQTCADGLYLSCNGNVSPAVLRVGSTPGPEAPVVASAKEIKKSGRGTSYIVKVATRRCVVGAK